MKARWILQLLAVVVGFAACPVRGGDLTYYERLMSLLDTNRFAPNLTNASLSLSQIKQSGEVAGLKLGSGMEAAVQHWGKPRNIYYGYTGGGPILYFGHGTLVFQGDKVARIQIAPHTVPGLRFEGGLTVTNTPADFAKALGVQAGDPEAWRLDVQSTGGCLELRWAQVGKGDPKLASLVLQPPQSVEADAP